MRSGFISAAFVAAMAGLAAADDFSPVVRGAVQDSPRDGAGDTVDTSTFYWLIRQTASTENRAFQEFDVSSLAGMNVTDARITGAVHVNNSFDNGIRSFQFIIYQGDGSITTADFAVTGSLAGTGAYAPPLQSSFSFDFDITAAVDALVGGGATHIGLMADPTSEPNFPNVLMDDTVLSITAEAAGCPADLSGSSDPNAPGYGVPDGLVDSSDFFYYLDQFVAGNLAVADVSGSSDPNDPMYGLPDGLIDAADFFFYLDQFVLPCP